MKRKQLSGGAFAEKVLLAAAPGAHARTEITCMFSRDENAEATTKDHDQSAATLKKANIKEYDQLIGKPNCNVLQATVGLKVPASEASAEVYLEWEIAAPCSS